MSIKLTSLFLLLSTLTIAQNKSTAKTQPYFPPPQYWQHKTPNEMGLNAGKIQEAIAFHKENEIKNPRSMEQSHYQSFGKEPFGFAVGPFTDRGEPTGVIIHKGYIIAEWGEPLRCDLTHSVTKSFLSTIVGLAIDKGMIRNVNDTVASYLPPIELYDQPVMRSADDFGKSEMLKPFDTPHNRTLRGMTFCAKRAIGKALCGANQNGQTVLMPMPRHG